MGVGVGGPLIFHRSHFHMLSFWVTRRYLLSSLFLRRLNVFGFRASVGHFFGALFSMIVIGLFGIIRAILDVPQSPVFPLRSNHLLTLVRSRANASNTCPFL